jgi:hypothetical protein
LFIKDNLIDFSEKTLLQGFHEGTDIQVEDYKDFISIIFQYKNNLIFNKVNCSKKTVFLKDTKNELWGTYYNQSIW